MPHSNTLEYNEEVRHREKVNLVRFSGVMDAAPGADIDKSLRSKALDLGYYLLMDFRACEFNFGFGQAYKWFEDFYEPEDEPLKHVKTAHLFLLNQRRMAELVTHAWPTQGVQTKGFFDEAEALHWLQLSES